MARIESLKRKLAAREGKAEFAENCAHIRAELARLEPDGSFASFIRANDPKASAEGLDL